MEIKDEFDLEFGLLIREIENYIYSSTYDKSVRIRISNWCKKISQISNNLEWKKNRNLHAINLLNMLLNGRIEEPYNKNPDDRPLQVLSKTLVKSKLTYKFWESVKHIHNSDLVNYGNSENRTNYKSPKKKQNGKVNNNKNASNFNGKILKNYASSNNINKLDKFKSKRVKTPNVIHRNLSAINNYNTNKIKTNIFKNNNEPIKIKIENKLEKELNFLRETAVKLQQELNQNEEIIEIQNEENNALKNKIMKLTEILKTLI